MFNFIKKAGTGVSSDKEEKEKRKRDKKDRKEKQKRDRASLSTEDLLRLDEVNNLWDIISVRIEFRNYKQCFKLAQKIFSLRLLYINVLKEIKKL